MRSCSHHLHYSPDRPVLNQLSGMDGTLHMQPFTVIDHVFLARLRGFCACSVHLLQRGERRFIREIILAVRHDLQAQLAPLRRNGGSRHQMNFGIFQHLGLGGSHGCPGYALQKPQPWRGLGHTPTSAWPRPQSSRCTCRIYGHVPATWLQNKFSGLHTGWALPTGA